jgi:ferredoxin/flavodoxin---NADP+ reductase
MRAVGERRSGYTTRPGESAPRNAILSAYYEATVLTVRHWTDRLFSFTCTREPSFRFQSGQFAMIGLRVEGKPLVRAYSMVSPHYEDTLEFLSIKVQDGPLTSRLQHIVAGDKVLVGRKPSGTLLMQNLVAGKRLYLFGTGTGLAPFMSIIRDPEAYERYQSVVLVHGCRLVSELAYDEIIRKELPSNEYFGEEAARQLRYLPTVTREPFERQARIPELIESGRLAGDLDLPELNCEEDRVMLCGSPSMLASVRAVLDKRGFDEGNMSRPGTFVIERAFVEK